LVSSLVDDADVRSHVVQVGSASCGLFGELLSLLLYFSSFSHVYRRQEVVDNIILPVVDHPISLDLLGLKIYTFNSHSRVAGEISECYFLEFFCE